MYTVGGGSLAGGLLPQTGFDTLALAVVAIALLLAGTVALRAATVKYQRRSP